MAFSVITDTSGNLPKFMADEYGLKVIPFYYHVDGKDLCCEAIEDFDSESYYRRLKEGPRVTTTQITPQRYLEYFEEEAKAGRDFIYVSMSGGISGSCDSARVALRMLAEDHPDVKAFVVDTKGAALGEGFVALEAARLRDQGLSIEEAVEKLEDYSRRMCNVFTVDDLMYLKRGGRLSNAAAWIGTILNIKPLLKGDADGKIVAFAKIRGRKKAVEALAGRYEALVEHPEEQTVGIVQAACEEDAKRLEEMICRSRPPKEILHVDYEPVTTSYVGPGALALFFLGGPDIRTELDRAGARTSPALAAMAAVRDAAGSALETVTNPKTVEAVKDIVGSAVETVSHAKPVEAVKNAAESAIETVSHAKPVEAVKKAAGSAIETVSRAKPVEAVKQAAVIVRSFWNKKKEE
ncbi:MAG: DegV family protein [Lachnospiraceae bacterium]|nr:DegV family protein [Lachnospiraceae bacterium]